MVSFSTKPLAKTATLGERLREVRREGRLSVAEAAAQIAVPRHHLGALEAGAYNQLPGDVYTRNFLRRYAGLLELNEERVLERYDRERALIRPAERRLPQPIALPQSVTLAVVARRAGLAVIILVILGYLGWELGKIIAPPSLVLESPAASVTTREPTIEVRGRTDREASVFINGQAVFVSQQGTFRELVDLQPGRNTIQVTAVKKRGKRSTLSREIVFEQPTAAASGQLTVAGQ